MSSLDVSDGDVSVGHDRAHPAAQDPLGGDALSDPLEDVVQLTDRGAMEKLMGADFEAVRAHSGQAARDDIPAMALTTELGAPGLTVEPAKSDSTAAHEAAHVAQQHSS